jgi:hypothetical protein
MSLKSFSRYSKYEVRSAAGLGRHLIGQELNCQNVSGSQPGNFQTFFKLFQKFHSNFFKTLKLFQKFQTLQFCKKWTVCLFTVVDIYVVYFFLKFKTMHWSQFTIALLCINSLHVMYALTPWWGMEPTFSCPKCKDVDHFTTPTWFCKYCVNFYFKNWRFFSNCMQICRKKVIIKLFFF